MVRSARWSMLSLALASACTHERPASAPTPEPTAAATPVVWTERETLDDSHPESAEVGRFDVSRFQTAVIGVAHGPSRSQEARTIADAILELGLPIDDVWEVDAGTWSEDGGGRCVDRIAVYTDEGWALVAELRSRLPAQLEVGADETTSNYDVIVQLCPPGLMRSGR